MLLKSLSVFFFLAAFSLSAFADDEYPAQLPGASSAAKPDNTAVNKRDVDSKTLTPIDQAKGSKRDVELTRKIRRLVMKDKALSTTAKNIKIITLGGIATLRGPVNTALEREKIETFAAKIVGAGSVTNELEVKANN